MPDSLNIPGERPRALRWTDQHALSSYGNGVMVFRNGNDILDGSSFRALRDGRGAWIETNKPDRARRALGMMVGESLGVSNGR